MRPEIQQLVEREVERQRAGHIDAEIDRPYRPAHLRIDTGGFERPEVRVDRIDVQPLTRHVVANDAPTHAVGVVDAVGRIADAVTVEAQVVSCLRTHLIDGLLDFRAIPVDRNREIA